MRIKKEIKKCIILCANCHRELHAKIIKIDFDAIMPIKCPIKQAANSAKHYQRNKEKIKLRAKIRTQKIRIYHRKLIARYKLWIGCKFCNYKRCNQALELHHIGKQKEQHVADLVQKEASTKVIKREIRRCIVVCANCHRELHENMLNLE